MTLIESGRSGLMLPLRDIREFQARGATGHAQQQPAEDGPQQRAESKVQEVNDAGRSAANLRRIGFLDYGVGQHRRTGCESCDQTDHVWRKEINFAVQDPREAIQEHDRRADDHRFASPDPI